MSASLPLPRSPGRSCPRSPAAGPEALHRPCHPGSHFGPKAAFSHRVSEHGDKHQRRGPRGRPAAVPEPGAHGHHGDYAAPRHRPVRARGLGNTDFRMSLRCLRAGSEHSQRRCSCGLRAEEAALRLRQGESRPRGPLQRCDEAAAVGVCLALRAALSRSSLPEERGRGNKVQRAPERCRKETEVSRA